MRSNKGFTLIEAVVSLAVFGVMMALVAGIFGAAASKTAVSLNSSAQRERLLTEFEEIIATGIIPNELERQRDEIVIDFDGYKINAGGEYIAGVYGDDRIIMRYFHTEN